MSSRFDLEPDLLGRFAERLISSHLRPGDLREEGAVPGRIGRYSVARPLGRGPHGRSFLADDPQLHRQVVVQLLDGIGHEHAEAFTHAMRKLAALDHAALARVYDAGVTDEGPYFVVEHVDQPSLADANLPLPQAVAALEQAARGLHAAHQQQTLHLSLDPQRILVGARTVVVDLGLASTLGTLDGLSYRPPEQLSQGEVSRSADVYALGAVLYELLSGQPPFESGDRTALPRNPAALSSSPPLELCRLAMQALHEHPSQRPPSAAAFAERLRRWREEPVQPATGRLQPTAAGSPPQWSLLAVVAGLAIALGVCMGMLARSQRSPAPASAVPAGATPNPQTTGPESPPLAETPAPFPQPDPTPPQPGWDQEHWGPPPPPRRWRHEDRRGEPPPPPPGRGQDSQRPPPPPEHRHPPQDDHRPPPRRGSEGGW